MNRPPFKFSVLVALFVVAVVIIVRLIFFSDGDDSYVQQEASVVRERLREAGALPTGDITVEQSAWSGRATWECELNRNWDAFLEGVDTELKRDFHPHARTDTSAELTRQVPGDAHHLRVELLYSDPPAVVRITFTSTAD